MLLFTKFLKFPILPIVPISMNPVRSALTFAQLYVASLYLSHHEVAATDKDCVIRTGKTLGMKYCLAYCCNALIVKSNCVGCCGNILDVAGTVNLRTCEDIVCIAG